VSRRRDPSFTRPNGDAAAADALTDEPASGFRVIRAASESPRRWNRRAALLLSGLVLGLLAVGVAWQWMVSAVAWLQDREEYRVRFDAIQLIPTPPPYVRSGASGVLDRVRQAAHLPDTLSTLKVDPKALGSAFALGSPWIEQVLSVRVVGYPNRVVVALRYRRPVAFFGTRRPVWLGFRGSGVVPRAGLALEPAGSEERPVLQSALKLAAFLLDQNTPAQVGDHRLASIGLANGPRWLSLHTADGYRISWGEAPGEESPGHPKAREKWEALTRWFEQEQLSVDERNTHFLSFAGKVVIVRPDPPPR
jgi:hypothetical protein